MDLGIAVVLIIFGSMISTFIALSKRRNAVGWFLFGMFMPIIAVVAIACLPPLPPPAEAHQVRWPPPSR
jgi:hypothetical protein